MVITSLDLWSTIVQYKLDLVVKKVCYWWYIIISCLVSYLVNILR